MKTYFSVDGLMLATLSMNKKLNLYNIMNTIDYIDRSMPSIVEFNGSISRLLSTKLITIKNNKVYLSNKAKIICRGGFFVGAIDWQLKVRERLCKLCYDENSIINYNYFSEQEYIDCEQKRKKDFEKFVEKENKNNKQRKFIEKCNKNIEKNKSCKFTIKEKNNKFFIVLLCVFAYMIIGAGIGLFFLNTLNILVKIVIFVVSIVAFALIGSIPLSIIDYGYPLNIGEIPKFEKAILIIMHPANLLIKFINFLNI